MATPEVIAEQQALVGINADYKEKFGFHDAENYLFKAPKGLTPRARRADLRVQERAASGCASSASRRSSTSWPPAAHLGLADAGRGRLRRHPLLRPRLREVARRPGTTSPRTSRTPSTASASRRPSASSSPASAPSTSPRSSTTRSARTSRSRASSSWTWTPRCASTRTSCASTSRRSSRPTTTSSPRSTAPCGRAARSSTCRRACTSRCRCRPTSASTPRTWASSSGR